MVAQLCLVWQQSITGSLLGLVYEVSEFMRFFALCKKLFCKSIRVVEMASSGLTLFSLIFYRKCFFEHNCITFYNVLVEINYKLGAIFYSLDKN